MSRLCLMFGCVLLVTVFWFCCSLQKMPHRTNPATCPNWKTSGKVCSETFRSNGWVIEPPVLFPVPLAVPPAHSIKKNWSHKTISSNAHSKLRSTWWATEPSVLFPVPFAGQPAVHLTVRPSCHVRKMELICERALDGLSLSVRPTISGFERI